MTFNTYKKPAIILMLLAAPAVSVVFAQETVQTYFDQGRQLFEKGEYPEAVMKFEKVIELDANFAPAYNLLGLTHQQLGKPSADVVWFFKVAVEIDPKYLDAQSNLCRAYHQSGEFDKALAACREALAINPDHGPAQVSIAWVYLLGKSNPSEALGYFQKVLEKTRSPMVYFGMGLAYSQQGDTPRVLEMITELRALGEIDYASQLEQSIRKMENAPPAAKVAQDPGASGKSSSLIGAAPAPAVSETGQSSAPVSGQMQIRLKGQLSGSGEATNTPAPKKSSAREHPGSLGQ